MKSIVTLSEISFVIDTSRNYQLRLFLAKLECKASNCIRNNFLCDLSLLISYLPYISVNVNTVSLYSLINI